MTTPAGAPPRPAEGVVAWNVGTACNYRCSYCTQRGKADRGRWAEDLPAFLRGFARLEGDWEVKLSGGEPFQHPRIVDLVRGLAALGRRVSVVTNFSVSEAVLERFVDAVGDRAGTFSASLHLEYVRDPAAFAARAARLRRELRARAGRSSPPPSVNVTVVATRAALERLSALDACFAAEGLALKLQPEREDGRRIAYTPAELAMIADRGGHQGLGDVTHGFFGRPCWAGARFFILDHRGEAYRCYPARRAVLAPLRASGGRIADPERERTLGRLGSFLDPAFRLPGAPAPCLHRNCYCSVPIARGMMARTLPEEVA